jgi:hypothetical protein
MDNATHSLIGIAAAEALLTTRRPSAVANNLPDLEVIYARGPDRFFSSCTTAATRTLFSCRRCSHFCGCLPCGGGGDRK